jgi:hypothetical protein
MPTRTPTRTPRHRRADAPAQAGAFALRRMVQAVEAGHLARAQHDGSWLVRSDSRPASHRVVVLQVQSNGIVWLGCGCESALYRPHLPVPCKHAARVGLRLEHDRLVSWNATDGLWHQRRLLTVTAA